MAGSRGRKDDPPRGGAAPDAPAFAALFLGLRDTIARDGAAVLPNAELYAWVLDAFARDVARQGQGRGAGVAPPVVPYRTARSAMAVPACGNRLEEMLTRREMTKAELARRIGIARFTLTKIARGGRPSYDLAHAIARVLDSDVNVVFPPIEFKPRRREVRERCRSNRSS